MSQPCTTVACKRPSRAVCGCCKQDFCLPHLNEHNNSLVSQLNPFVDEINALGSRLMALDVEKMTGDCREKLEQWRVDCHKKIDRFFEQKCQEIDDLLMKKVDKQREEIDRLRSKVTKLIDEQEATRQDIEGFTSSIENLKREMSQIERTSIQVDVHPLWVDKSLIHFESEFELITLPPVYKTIKCSLNSCPDLASNNQFLLIHRDPNLCLIDRELILVQRTPWFHGDICDMCWSSSLALFIVITTHHVFFVDPNTMSIEQVQTIMQQNWHSGTCSDTSLFLSTHNWSSSIVEYRLLPSIQLVKQWQSPCTCTDNETIDAMVYKDRQLALMIKNQSNRTIHMELRSSSTLDRLWSLRLDITFHKDVPVVCCLYQLDEWLVVDRYASRLLHITKNGEVQATYAYNPAPYRSNLFGGNILAVSTHQGVNFHQL